MTKRIIQLELCNALALIGTEKSTQVVNLPAGLQDASIFIEYNCGGGEVGTYPEIVLESSYHPNGPFYPISVFDASAGAIAGNRRTVPCYEWVITPMGAVDGTPLLVSPIVQLTGGMYLSARVKETGVVVNHGTLTMFVGGTALQ